MFGIPRNTLPCGEAAEQLSPYLDGELEEKERRRLMRHLAHCSRCRKLLANLSRTVEGLRRLGARPS